MSPKRVHALGLLVTIAVAITLLTTLIPYSARTFFSPPLKGYNGLRFELLYYLTGALIPIGVWFVPALVRQLGIRGFTAHKMGFGRSGFYIRFRMERPVLFRTTIGMALGPFAVDMLAIVEIEHFFGNITTAPTGRGFFVAPLLLVLAGIITSLVPGAWLVAETGIRYLNPKKGEVVKVSAIYDGLLGPLSAAALLVSFITSLEGANYSYETAAFALGVWTLRLFPAVLTAVTVYRLFIGPNAFRSFGAWCDKQNISIRENLTETLEAVRA